MLRKASVVLAFAFMSGSVALDLGNSRAFAQEGGPRQGPRDTGEPSAEAEGGHRNAPEGDAARVGEPKETKAEKTFKTYDKDGNGKISGREWLKMFDGLSDKARLERVKGWGRKADRNRNGSITFKEFKWWMEVGKRQPEGRPSAESKAPARRSRER